MAQDPLGDIPLFKEIQKILSASEGPINYELARQVGLAMASQGPSGGEGGPEIARAYADAVHSATSVLTGYTRIPLPEPMSTTLMDRGTWVTSTLQAWRWLLDRLAARFAQGMSGIGPEAEQGTLQAAMGQVTPILMGLQAGTLLGHLARESLGRYDLPIVREDDARLFLVWQNADLIATDYGFERDRFLAWLGLNDAARRLVVAYTPWLDRYQRSLLVEVIESLEIDASDLERRMMDLQSKGLEALQQGMDAQEVLPIVPTERHRKALERLRSFLAAFEGYAEHAATSVAGAVVGDASKIEEGMARRRLTTSEGRTALEGLLGISVDRELEAAGRTFCAAVIQLHGPAALNRVWAAPDNLPTLDEIKDPFAWMDRVPSE